MNHYKKAIETFDKNASAYQEKFMDLDLYNDTYDVFCNLLNERPNAKIFEIACGPGNITKYLLSKRPDFKIKGIDLAPNMIKLAKENNPTADFAVMDCMEIDKLGQKFDGIMCGFCMPYLSKEECAKLVKNCSVLLNDGGIYYLSAIEGNYNKSGYEFASNGVDKSYVYYYEERDLLESLKENGFELVELKRKSYEKTVGVLSTHIIFIVLKRDKIS